MIDPSFFTSVTNNYLPEPHASLLNGILFGVKLKVSRNFYEEIKIVGLLHLVVLSGTNISFLSGLIAKLTYRFGKYLSSVIVIITVIFFIIFVQPQAPIVRAGVMNILTIVSFILGRKQLSLLGLFFAFLFTLVFYPSWVTSISFYLTYGATLGIILFGGIKSEGKADTFLTSVLEVIWSELKISLAAQVFTVPIIFFFFKQVSIISPIANVFVSPFIGSLMIFGFISVLLGKIHFILGIIPNMICYGILSWIIFVIDVLSKLPFSFIEF